MKNDLIFSMGLVALFVVPSVSHAQSRESGAISAAAQVLDDEEWQETIGQIKNETSALIEENRKLNGEYTSLQGKLEGLQETVNEIRRDTENVKKENRRSERDQKKYDARIRDYQDQVGSTEKALAEQEKENARLRDDLAAIKEKNELWTLKVQDLETRKREIQLDLRLMDVSQEEDRSASKVDEESLKTGLEYSKKKEALYQKTLKDLESQADTLTQQLAEEKAAVEALKDKVTETEKANGDLKEKNSRLAKMNAKIEQGLAASSKKAVSKERKQLEKEVLQLENELKSVRQSVLKSTAMLKEKRKLMDEIMQMDAENQRLRSQITGLMEQMKAARQTGMNEPLEEITENP